MKVGFLSTTRRAVDRVFDISLTLTLVGLLLNSPGWVLVAVRTVGLLGLLWSGMSYAMQWIYGRDKFKWWIHLLAFFVFVLGFCILSVVFNDDIQKLYE